MNTQRPTPGTALITGAAKRIGKAIALHLSTLGYDIALHYHHSKKEAEAARGEIEETGAKCSLHKCDLEDQKQAIKLIGAITKQHPNLNVLINNASVFEPSTLRDVSAKEFQSQFAVNLEAPLFIIQCFAQNCTKGHIINILDTHVANGTTGHAAYLLSKKALHGLTQIAAAEFAPAIKVNAIAPGLIMPPEGKEEGYLERLAKEIPMKRKGDVKNITKTVEFLLKSNYITGETIYVDGGEHLL